MRLKKLTISALLLLLITGFGASESFAQKKDKQEKRGTKITLEKNARKNGYKIWEKGGEFYFEANDVTDPFTKKLLEGLYELVYRCASENVLNRKKIELSRGNSKRLLIACAVISEPPILFMDEPDAN